MYSILIILGIIISIILMIVVLLQASKGEGLSGSIGGGMGGNFGTMFGSRRTADFLSKATWWLGGGLLVIALVTNLFFLPGQTTSKERESLIQSSGQATVPSQPTLPPAQLPQQNNTDQNKKDTPKK